MIDFKKLLPPEPDHISPEIKARIERAKAGESITDAEWDQMRANSWEREAMYPYLTDDAILKLTEYCISQCRMYNPYEPAPTYNEAVIHVLAPELIRRLKLATGTLTEKQNDGDRVDVS